VEAGLLWSIGKRRREEGGFPGAEVIARQIADGPERRRVGIRPDGRAPVRNGAAVLDAEGREIGIVTSGGYGPTVEAPVAMGYVARAASEAGTALQLVVRGHALPGRVVTLPFVAPRYRKA
jgi:aminomethyltransferase